MKEKILFKSLEGEQISNITIAEKLKSIGAHNCDVLYIHTSLSFGIPQIKKSELLEELFCVFKSLNIKTLIFPTFTFSFPNNEDFDVQNSKTTMGVLNEYFRKQPGVIRSIDPLMSVALLGEHTEFANNIGKNSCGQQSTFDLLYKTELNVKFLFLGTRIGDCFTFMHYIEDKLKAPYRYSRPFTGKIINNGTEYVDTFNLCVRYSNVFPNPGSYIYENILIERDIAKQVAVGDNYITIVPTKPAFAIYQDLIISYPSFFITKPFDPKSNTTDFVLKAPMAAL